MVQCAPPLPPLPSGRLVFLTRAFPKTTPLRPDTKERVQRRRWWRDRINTVEIFEGGYCPEMVALERACCTPGGPARTTGTNSREKRCIGQRARRRVAMQVACKADIPHESSASTFVKRSPPSGLVRRRRNPRRRARCSSPIPAACPRGMARLATGALRRLGAAPRPAFATTKLVGAARALSSIQAQPSPVSTLSLIHI